MRKIVTKTRSITASTLDEGDTDSDYRQGSVSLNNAGGANRIAIQHYAEANAGPGGSLHGPTQAAASAALDAVQIENPNCDCTIDAFSASDNIVNPGDSFDLDWSSTDVSGDLTAGGTWSGQKNQSGSSTLSAPSPPGTYEYTLSGSGDSGRQCSASETIAVNKIPETAPDGQPDPICVPLAGSTKIDVVKNDGAGAGTYLDQEGDPIYIASVQPGGAGLVTDTDGSSDFEPGDHELSFDPAAVGTTTFTYTIQDAHGGQSAPETVYTEVKTGCGQINVTFSTNATSSGGVAYATQAGASGSSTPTYDHPAFADVQLPTQSVAIGATTTWNVPLESQFYTAELIGNYITAPPGYQLEPGEFSGIDIEKATEVADFTNSQTSARLGLDYTAATDTAPTARFSYTPTSPATGQTVSFTDQSTDDGPLAGWSWSFGDGNGSTNQDPSHAYATSGTYSVTLQVTDDDGATSSTSTTVTVTTAPTNQPPTANVIVSLENVGDNDTSRSFTADSYSSDPDGSIATDGYDWEFIGYEGAGDSLDCQPSQGTIDNYDGNDSFNGDGAVTSETDGATSTCTYSLTVTDNDGATSTPYEFSVSHTLHE